MFQLLLIFFFFFFNDTATTEIYTLSLHDALPICRCKRDDCRESCKGSESHNQCDVNVTVAGLTDSAIFRLAGRSDRKSTRLNSSHLVISYAVFCLKKKKKHTRHVSSVRSDSHVKD